MRYTLRLLTLDQLGRASTLICALELERKRDKKSWVALAFRDRSLGWAGRQPRTGWAARATATKPPPACGCAPTTTARPPIKPIPIDTCPWCGVEFGKRSLDDPKPCGTAGVFNLLRQGRPDGDNPEELRVACLNRDCAFTGTKRPQLPAPGRPSTT